MYREELEELLAKPANALTSKDVETLTHVSRMIRDMPGYLDTYQRRPRRKSLIDVTRMGSTFVERIAVE